mgnify:CR=1 FL=1
MYDYAETMELDVDTLIHESGAGQLEVNFQHADAMSRADNVFLFKRCMREAALHHGIYATFLAKPMANEPGSAMHIHQSLVDADGDNVFAGDKAGQHSQLFMHYLGGLQKYVPMAMPFFAPNVNSYRRLAIGQVAPINVQWGYDNRTCGLRVPMDSRENTRVESRFAGSDSNPYLAMAATLACGYLGIKNRIEPTPECKGDAYLSEYQLPRSLNEAMEALGTLAEAEVPAFHAIVRSYKAHERASLMGVAALAHRGPFAKEAAGDYKRVADEVLRDW